MLFSLLFITCFAAPLFFKSGVLVVGRGRYSRVTPSFLVCTYRGIVTASRYCSVAAVLYGFFVTQLVNLDNRHRFSLDIYYLNAIYLFTR